jgi:hypothetical protein
MPSDEDVIYVNGIDPETGEYAIPPFSISDLAKQVRARPGVDTVTHTRGATRRSYGLPYGVQAGWGIVFHEDAQQDVRMALAPLIELRRMQAGGNFKELDYKKGE